MKGIYWRPKDSPKGTPFRLGFAIYPGGNWIDIAPYNGCPFTVRYKLSEIEIEEGP